MLNQDYILFLCGPFVDTCNNHGLLLLFQGLGEIVEWKETSTVQFPRIIAKITRPCFEWYNEEG